MNGFISMYDIDSGTSKYKLFCTFTMEFYWQEGDSLLDARRRLSRKLNYPLDSIIECAY